MEFLGFLIIIGLISSIFNKNNQRQQQQRPMKKTTPNTGRNFAEEEETNLETPFMDWEDSLEELEKRFTRRWTASGRSEGNDETMEKAEPTASFSKTEMSQPTSPSEKSEIVESPIVDTQGTIQLEEDMNTIVDPKNAAQGMMWAEIFGPPRSKRPFRFGSYQNKN